jgi:hypothetical protein
MSIAILTQVYDETRRLAVAGSVVAPGDFRLKKLVAPLEQAGARAPVFVRVAEAVKAVADGDAKSSPGALLELATLVNAVLYTQGETGAPGELRPIETTDLGAPAAQASARVIKPLLEALTTTGSGRLELIRDAHARGAFRDLRLVKPALAAIDDVYGEIADFVAENVLPIYGKAILLELRSGFDIKGNTGHARRLKLMHALDPAGTRELVKQALDAGSKEVKVAAVECLGADPEDLSYLIEQASAKAQDVRQAAYRALANLGEEAAVVALRQAALGKDLNLAARALRDSRAPAIVAFIIAETDREIAALSKPKDKKEVSKKLTRASTLLGCLAERDDKESEAFLLKLFARRDELAKVKGDSHSGTDLNTQIVGLLSAGPPSLQRALAQAHALLTPEELAPAFAAARRSLPVASVYELFSSYLTARVDEKKKQRDPAWARREAIIDALGGSHVQYPRYVNREFPPLDPRWVDLAVSFKHVGLLGAIGHRDHPASEAFLKTEFDAALKAKAPDRIYPAVTVMVLLRHPIAAEALVAAYEKTIGKPDGYTYWYHYLVPELPKAAIPKLEALVPKLKDREADAWVRLIEELRNKNDQ